MVDTELKSFVKKLDFTNGKYSNRDVFRDVIALELFIIQRFMLLNRGWFDWLIDGLFFAVFCLYLYCWSQRPLEL